MVPHLLATNADAVTSKCYYARSISDSREREGKHLQDHEYSVIGHSRSTIGRWLGMLATLIVSLLPAVGIGLSDALTRYGLPEWGKLRCHSNHCRRDLHSYPLVFQ